MPAPADLLPQVYNQLRQLAATKFATAPGISPSTADRRWTFARAWLKRAMQN